MAEYPASSERNLDKNHAIHLYATDGKHSQRLHDIAQFDELQASSSKPTIQQGTRADFKRSFHSNGN
jgi:hypothetical protein